MQQVPLPKPPKPLWVFIYIDQWAAQVLHMSDPNLHTKAFVVLEQNPKHYKTQVTAVSSVAQLLGIRCGSLWVDMVKRHPKLQHVMRSLSLEHSFAQKMLQFLDSFSPEKYCLHTGMFTINLAGTPLQRNTPIHQLGELLQQNILRHFAVEYCALGVSHHKTVAYMLARNAAPNRNLFCPSGKEIQYLSNFSPQLLPQLSIENIHAMHTYGFSKIEQLIELTRQEILQHFGQEGSSIYGWIHGLDQILVSKISQPILIRQVFPKDLNDIHVLNTLVHQAVDRFCFELSQNKQDILGLRVCVGYVDKKVYTQSIKLNKPIHLFKDLLAVVRPVCTKLMDRRLSVRYIELNSRSTRESSQQLSLFDTSSHQRQDYIGKALTKIRKKNGFAAIVNGNNISPQTPA